jgi:hypothetical protein
LDEREEFHLDRKKAAMRKALEAAWKAYDEAMEKIKEWESNFIDVETPLLFKIIQAANCLGNTGLLGSSCRNAAEASLFLTLAGKAAVRTD